MPKRSDFTMDATGRELVAEASTLGIPPGPPPEQIDVDGVPFFLVYADEEQFQYEAKVVVWND